MRLPRSLRTLLVKMCSDTSRLWARADAPPQHSPPATKAVFSPISFRLWTIPRFLLTSAIRLWEITTLTMKRSEEHTSELQSHSDLVCRLLLEKKNHSKS